MKRILPIFLTVLMLAGFTQTAIASENAYVRFNVNLRSGPDGNYDSIAVLRKGQKVELVGCAQGFVWCEVEARNNLRGWVFADYLETRRGNRPFTIIETARNGDVRIIIFKPRHNYHDNDEHHGHTPRPPRPVTPEQPKPAPQSPHYERSDERYTPF